MKKFSYVDMVKEFLPEEEFLQFEQRYTKPVKKSMKPMNSRLDFSLFERTLANDGRNLKKPDFSFGDCVYDDVWFVEKEDKQSLGSHWMHQAGLFYVQEMAAGMSAQVLMHEFQRIYPEDGGEFEKDDRGLVNISENGKLQKSPLPPPAVLTGQAFLKGGSIVLDMCAAPGGKSIQLADGIKSFGETPPVSQYCETTSPCQGRPNGLLISNELNPQRRKALLANVERCGMENVVVTGYDGRKLGELLYEQCDKVLLDAPCSGEGMQYKSDFKVYGRNEKAVRKIAHLQQELLISGLQALKVGGELVYSTCTTNVIENEMVVASILEKFGDTIEFLDVKIDQKSDGISQWREKEILSVDNAKRIARFWPHIHHTGGFFIAKFRKIRRISENYSGELKRIGKNSFGQTPPAFSHLPLSEKTKVVGEKWNYSEEVQQEVGQYLEEYFGLEQSDFDDYVFVKSKFTIQVVPKKLETIADKGLFFEQVGLPILKLLNDGSYIPLIGLAKVFGNEVRKNVLDIDETQAKLLMQKTDLSDERLAEFEGKFVILRWNGVGIGLVSVQKGIGKNKV